VIVVLVGLVVFGLVGVLAATNPLLARMAAREVVRRRGQSLLVVGGLMIGAAAITASLIGADSSQDSFLSDAYRSWGRVDLTVGAASAYFPPEAVDALEADPEVRRLTDGVTGVIHASVSAADLTRRQSDPEVTLIGFDARRQLPFGRFLTTWGLRTLGNDLGPNGVIVSRGLARALHAQPGDRLVLLAGRDAGATQPIVLNVAGIAVSTGPGAFGLRPTVFAPLPLAQEVTGTDGINQIWVSATGGLVDGVTGGETAAPTIRRALQRARLPLTVRQSKRSEVETARTNTEFLRMLLLAMSFLIVAAGAALVVNLVLMLAEERRPRLGVMRALGLKRWRLIEMSIIEGALYSVAAALVGTLIGIGAGRVVAARFASAFAQFTRGQADTEFHLSLHSSTLAVSFAAGALITLITVAFASRRTSRMSIPAAIRDLPEPARQPGIRWLRWVVAGALGLLGLSLVVQSQPFGRLAGGTSLILGASAVARRRLSPRAHTTLLGAALAGWAFVMTNTLRDPSLDPGTFFPVFIGAVLLAVFGLSILASANLRLIEQAASRVSAGSGAVSRTLRAPLAYLARRPMRTGLTTGMFAVIMTILAMFSVFLFAFRPQYRRDSVGYDIRIVSTGSSTIEIPPRVQPDVQRTAELTTLGYLGPIFTKQFSIESFFVPLYVLDAGLGGRQPIRIAAREQRFQTDAEVWRAVLRNPHFVLSDFFSPGEKMTLTTPSGKVTFEIIAQQQAGIIDGVVATPQALSRFGGLPRGDTVLVDLRPGTNAASAARRVEAGLFTKGVDAETTRALLDEAYRANKTFFSVIDILMRMGLIVGILSLGILGLRAVVERRHVIGVLRAMGYRRRGIMAGLVAEAGVTATLGVVVGVVTGLVMGFLFIREQAGTSAFGVDGASLGGVLLLVYVAVLLVTLWPAWRASRLPPAEAVRYSE
jgi:putative ABC transport system permease protein